jgi:hypothetical protein
MLGCHVVLKAFSTSKNIAAVDISLLTFRVTWFRSVMHWSVLMQRARERNWLAFSKLLPSSYLWTVLITFSNSLPVVDRRLSVLNVEGILSPYLASVRFTFASLQVAGKYDSQKQWLNKWVKWTNGLLGRCLRHSFGMPSVPQTFLTSRGCINFCTSHWLTDRLTLGNNMTVIVRRGRGNVGWSASQ